jgi:hypothetical protein
MEHLWVAKLMNGVSRDMTAQVELKRELARGQGGGMCTCTLVHCYQTREVECARLQWNTMLGQIVRYSFKGDLRPWRRSV